MHGVGWKRREKDGDARAERSRRSDRAINLQLHEFYIKRRSSSVLPRPPPRPSTASPIDTSSPSPIPSHPILVPQWPIPLTRPPHPLPPHPFQSVPRPQTKLQD